MVVDDKLSPNHYVHIRCSYGWKPAMEYLVGQLAMRLDALYGVPALCVKTVL